MPKALSSVFDAGKDTRVQLGQIGQQASQLTGLRSRVQANIGNSAARQKRQLGGAASLAAQQEAGDQATGATSHASTVANALKRAKARTGIAGRGDKAIRNQQLKNRLTQVRAGVAQKGRAIDLQTQGASIRAGVDTNKEAASLYSRSATAGAIGSAAGGLAATLKNNQTNNKSLFDFGAEGPGIFKK